MPQSPLPRRSVLLGLLAAPLTVAACSKDKPSPGPSSTTATPSTTTPPASVTGAKLPADLLATLTALYLGGKPATSGTSVTDAIAKRTPRTGAVAVTGTTGTWQGTPIATIVEGDDVTLLVKAKQGWTVVGGWWPSLKVARPAFPTMRILAIGSDARNPQPVEKCRADALHIIGVDAKGVGGIVGIPRDSWVRLSTGGNNKINAALAFGGAKAQAKTVANATGVPIDGYVIAGFKGFRGMVKGVGGIVFVASKALKSVDGLAIVKPGTNKLDATHALALARERKHLSNGDFGRSANQGLLIRAGMVMAQKAGPGQLANLLSRMGPHLKSDLSIGQILNLSASLYLSNAAQVPNKVASGAIGTRERQSVVLLGSPARSIFSDMKNGRLSA